MARKTKFSKEEILKKSIEFIKEFGYFKLTVRDLTKYIGCSTQPIFKNFNNFEEYKDNLKLYLRDDYNSFIKQYIDEEDYLYTISYAYALFAKEELNIFFSMFIYWYFSIIIIIILYIIIFFFYLSIFIYYF